MGRFASVIWLTFTGVVLSVAASAQTGTYHLHKETSATSGLFQLKTAGPDGTSLAVQTINLKNQPIGEYAVKAFDTSVGVPGVAGLIPSGSAVSLTLWMKKTANFGVMVPKARVKVNNAGGALLCEATGSSSLTTSLASPHTLSCVTGANVTLSASDRFYVWIGVNVTCRWQQERQRRTGYRGHAGRHV